MHKPENFVRFRELFDRVPTEVWTAAQNRFRTDIEDAARACWWNLQTPPDIILGWFLEFCRRELYASKAFDTPFSIDDRFFGNFKIRPGNVVPEYGDYIWPQIYGRWNIDRMAGMKQLYIESGNRNGYFESQAQSFAAPLLFLEWDTGRISLEFYDWLARIGQLGCVEIVSDRYGSDVFSTPDALRELHGCSLFVSEIHVKKYWSRFWHNKKIEQIRNTSVTAGSADPKLSQGSVEKGRPPKKRIFSIQYLDEMYGKDLSPKVSQNMLIELNKKYVSYLESTTGEKDSISYKTLDRAVKRRNESIKGN